MFARRLSTRSSRRRRRRGRRPAVNAAADVVVCVSGNLAHVYFARVPGRMTREAIEELHPGLLAGLAGHPGIGVLLVRTEDGRTIAQGAGGERDLAAPPDEGFDPLDQYGPYALDALANLEDLAHVGDVILLGRVDEGSGEVMAFEDLIGSHGGLGGWQTEPFLMCPASWSPAADPIVGATALNRQLRDWLNGRGVPDAVAAGAPKG